MPKKTPTKPTPGRPITWTTALTRFFAHLVEHEKSDHTQKNYREDLLAFTAWYRRPSRSGPTSRLGRRRACGSGRPTSATTATSSPARSTASWPPCGRSSPGRPTPAWPRRSPPPSPSARSRPRRVA